MMLLSVAALLSSSVAHAVPVPRISVSGDCPDGVTTVEISGITWNSQFAILTSPLVGSAPIPESSPMCPGTRTDLGSIELRGIRTSDGSGQFTLVGELPAAMCGHYIQVIDLSNCVTSNTEPLPLN